MTPVLSVVHRQFLPAAWPKVEGFLDRACRKVATHLTVEKIRDAAERGTMWIWVVHDRDAPDTVMGAGATSIIGKVLHIEALGGRDMKVWRHLMPELEAMAKANGIEEIEVEGRKGWMREMRDYSLVRVVLRKRL